MTRQPDYDRAASMAYRCLLKLGICRLPVPPLDILRKCRDTAVYTYQQAAEYLHIDETEFERKYGNADAFTVRSGKRYVVCYRKGGNPARLNFTLAHELGHILLRHTEDACADEAEANCFAGHLLCPEPVIRGKSPEEIAATCYVSKAAAEKCLRYRRGRAEDKLMEDYEMLLKSTSQKS